MKFLGILFSQHDANVTFTDGKSVKYYKSERDLNIKHHNYNDLTSWLRVIDLWKINPSEIDCIGVIFDSYTYPWIPSDDKKMYQSVDIPLFKEFGFDCPIIKLDHHFAHKLSIWTLNVKSDIDFVSDGFGDDMITHSIFKEFKPELRYNYDYAPSLGCVMGEVGYEIGLSGFSEDHAGKVMALKGHGKISKDNIIRRKKKYVNQDLTFFEKIWRIDEVSKMCKQELYDHIQLSHEVSEDIFVSYFKKHTNPDDVISFSGGIAQNIIINSRIKKERKNFHVPPHCADEGLSLGIVEFLRIINKQEPFDTTGYPYWQSDEAPEDRPTQDTIKYVAKELSNGKIVAWYQGHGEVGPRALGNRSILMDPTIKDGKDILNQKVKNREWFRPFGASILEEKLTEYFYWEEPSPYMLYCMDIKDKESYPAITHVDGTCRVQTVSKDLEDYYSLIKEFESITGVPMLLNTSLNNGGKPICGTISSALELFYSTQIDILIVGNKIYKKDY